VDVLIVFSIFAVVLSNFSLA